MSGAGSLVALVGVLFHQVEVVIGPMQQVRPDQLDGTNRSHYPLKFVHQLMLRLLGSFRIAVSVFSRGWQQAMVLGFKTDSAHIPERADCDDGRRIRRSRPDDSVVLVARSCAGSRRTHARGDGSSHSHDGGAPVLQNGPPARNRSPRPRLLHRPGKRQGPGVEGESICRCPLPLVQADAPTGPGDRRSGGGRCLVVGRLLAISAARVSS